MKSIVAQFGVRNLKPSLRKAAEKIDAVRTPEKSRLPPNAAAALRIATEGGTVGQRKAHGFLPNNVFVGDDVAHFDVS
jgi:hypothetical protein